MTHTKAILGFSLAALFVAMIVPVMADGHLGLLNGEVNNKKGNFEATLTSNFNDCPSGTVCGVGAFTAVPTAGHAATMLAITSHDFFNDHPDQDDDVTVAHTHTLEFDADDDCAAGVALNGAASGIIPGAKHEVDGAHVEVSNLTTDLDTTVHSFTVSFGPHGEICPVLIDDASDD
ncbi:hypothetical protein AAA799P11_01168 [Marine Group I thaumarchaeote SCGC AAA799-P11]|uniref:Uncharacterized protein n=1 Tax=Marine Group I thaumarchaeote SCGC AAA799-P11 TaxID=1502295 RepID=A0A087RXP2_9ARCH|nr:hypothetical protein AAA799P11_01168 [Marine Group I thaumarchaeote SCGC AAA799-P11]